MTLFVLDTSVALKWILPEPDSPQALAFQDDVRNAIHEIIAPDVFASVGKGHPGHSSDWCHS